jgi:DNA-3-methyladenine glycosylase
MLYPASPPCRIPFMPDKSQPLPASFFQRPTLDVCRELLGKNLCRATQSEIIRLPLTELEAYDGPDDLASHASHGMTTRNRVMFEDGGIWYVYLCYGIHWMLNVVTGAKGYPGAILIRGASDIDGPGKVTKALGVMANFNGKHADQKSGLWIEESGIAVPEHQVQKKPRIGVGYAGPMWAEKPYRYVWDRAAAVPFKGVVGMKDVGRG